jgi:hypothetical protein
MQQRVLAELRSAGISLVPFDELIDDPALWHELKADMDEFIAGANARLAGPWLRYAAGDALLGVVNAYRGAMTKLVDFDLWYTVPVGEEQGRVDSQQWHRDPEDQHVVKVFLYFSEVDDEAGPFEYIPDSAEGGTYGHLWPWGKGSPRYPPTEELEQAIPASERIAATGPAGTLVICDTSGFHRGGYARSKPRILSTHTYVNKKITADRPERRKFQVDWRGHELSEPSRFALT